MAHDEEIFVFGRPSRPDELARLARERLWRLHHDALIDPPDPAPGQPVRVLIDAPPGSLQGLAVAYSTAGPPSATSPLAEAEPLALRWDDLAFGYVARWQATIPGQPAGARVRYILRPTLAPESPISGDDPPELFGYDVDALQTPDWVTDAVLYQIFVDSFAASVDAPGRQRGGTLNGAADRLDHLAELGIDAIWLTPIFASETDHGYDTLDYQRIDERLGGESALRRFVHEAHRRGMRVLLDFTANHLSWHHPWFTEAQQSQASPYYQWFSFSHWPDQYAGFANLPYLPKLNTREPEVRRYLVDVAVRYLTEFELDGFRLDHVIGPSLLFWSELRTAVRDARPDAYTVGEATIPPGGIARYQGRLDGCLDFPLLYAVRRFVVRRDLDARQFHSFLTGNDSFYQPGFSHPSFLDNHDMNRFLWAVGGDKRRLRLAAVWQFSYRQPPIIYYGTEVGLSQVADVREAAHPAARLPMPWDQQDRELFDFYRTLIAARRAHPALRRGSRQVLLARGGVYVYACSAEDDTVVVALNNEETPNRLRLDRVRGTDLLTGESVDGQLELPPFGAALVTVDR